jgi:Fe2+ or Zn2+ uptake regulation protein
MRDPRRTLPIPEQASDYEETIHRGGFRFTKQRREVYDALLKDRDHPTAVEVFLRVKERVPGISLATVYNCLETLTKCGLVRQVNLHRAPSRFCPNLSEHGHFFCEKCGKVIDADVADHEALLKTWQLPEGAIVKHHEFTLRGICPECANPSQSTTKKRRKP